MQITSNMPGVLVERGVKLFEITSKSIDRESVCCIENDFRLFGRVTASSSWSSSAL